MQEKPTWKNVERTSFHPALKENISADVVIVGAGLAGVLTAYKLAKEGKSVVVLEKKKIGSGATEYTTAFITQDIDTDLVELEKMFGSDQARMIWESHGAAISELEKTVIGEIIDCEFKRCSSHVYTMQADGIKGLEEEVETAKRLGFDVSLHTENKLQFNNFGYMETKNQAKFHPLKFLFRLSEIAHALGVKFYENTEVEEVKFKDSEWYAKTKDGFVATGFDVVLSTYYPLDNPVQTLFKKGMYVSYVFEVHIPKGAIPEGIYWDDDNPYHYFRIDALSETHDRMIIGGEDHRAEIKMNEQKSFNALEEHMREILGDIPYHITRKWTGPILEPSDGIALIGETYDRQYVATAFSGNGMTYSALSSMIVTDLILGRGNVWASLYDPKRIPSLYQLFKKGKDYVGEFLGGAGENIFKSGANKSQDPMPV